MTEGPPTPTTLAGIRAGLKANLDFTFAGVAAITFIAAQIVHPTVKCGPGIHPSVFFDVFAWTSGLSFLLASFLAFASRKHLAAKISLFLVGLFVTLIASISLVAASSPFGLGLVDSDSERPTLQSDLRILASPPAAGKHGYWLGASFRNATVSGTQDFWSPNAELYYSHIDEQGVQDIYIVVTSYRAGATEERTSDRNVIVHTKSGQDVRISFPAPHKADAALIAEARAAVQAIPRDVEYSGCD